jgi:hypothetical protein
MQADDVEFSTCAKRVDVASVEIGAETRKISPGPLAAGGLALSVGIALVVVTSRKP